MRKWLLAILAVALAFPTYAFNVKIHGDFRQSFGWSNEAGFTDGYKYKVFTGSKSEFINKGVIVDKRSLSNVKKYQPYEFEDDFEANAKYRMWFTVSDDAKKVIGVWAMEVGSLWYGEKDRGGKYSGDGNNYETRWLYLDFQNPFVSFKNRFRMGLQSVGFNYWVWSETAMGVKMYGDIGPVGYALAWFRPRENSRKDFGNKENEGKHDAFWAKFSYKYAGFNFNLFGLYLRADSVGSSLTSDGNYDDERYYIGLEVKGKRGPLGAWVNVIYLGGEVQDKLADEDYDRSAWFIHGDFTYSITSKLAVRFAGIYATGDDDPDDGDLDNWAAIDIDNSKYSVIFWEGIALDDGEFSDAPYFYDKGLNLIYAGLIYKFNKQFKGEFGANYIATDEDLEWIDKDGRKQSDDYLGTEVDLRLHYEMMKGVYIQFTAGYLFAGDAMDLYDYQDDANDIFRAAMRVKMRF